MNGIPSMSPIVPPNYTYKETRQTHMHAYSLKMMAFRVPDNLVTYLNHANPRELLSVHRYLSNTLHPLLDCIGNVRNHWKKERNSNNVQQLFSF